MVLGPSGPVAHFDRARDDTARAWSQDSMDIRQRTSPRLVRSPFATVAIPRASRYPSFVARVLFVLALTTLAVACGTQDAAAQEPIVIPVITKPEPTNPIPAGKFQPMQPPELSERGLWYPEDGSGLRFPKQYAALQVNGYVSLLGSTAIWPVVWDDVGSGKPVQQGSIGSRWQFPLPGKYSYHCQCPLGVRGEGDVYVVGPRPRVTPLLTSPDNKPPVSYVLDASASSVTDWKPWSITRYDFDLNASPTASADGIYDTTAPDQSGPESSAPIAFSEPGIFGLGLRVWDNYDSDPNTDGTAPRSQEIPIEVIVPKRVQEITVKPPGDDLPAPGGDGGAFKRTYTSAKIRLKTRGKVSLAVLRKKGLTVRVSGLTVGDVLTPSVTKGKRVQGKKARKVTSPKERRASATTMTLKIRFSKKAAAVLRAKPKAKIMRLAVLVEGADGFNQSYAKNVKVG